MAQALNTFCWGLEAAPASLLTLLAALIKALLKPNRVKGLLKDRKTPSANQSLLCKRPAVEQCPRPTFMGCTCEPGWRGRRATSNVSTRELYHLLAAPPRCVGPAHYSHRPEATAIRKTPESVRRCPRLCSRVHVRVHVRPNMAHHTSAC